MKRGSIRFWFMPCRMNTPGIYGFQTSGAGMLTVEARIRVSFRATGPPAAGALAGAAAAGAWAGVAAGAAHPASNNVRTATPHSIFQKLGLTADIEVPP